MNWFRKLLTSAMWLCIAHTLQAQLHYNVWFRSTLSIPIGKKFKIDNEFQHRRQNGFDNANVFSQNLMITYRIWAHYHHSQNVKFSISPFAYFSHYKIIQKQEDETTQANSEIRFSAAIELQNVIVKKFYLVERTAIEYRMFDNNVSDITRLRTRFGFRYEFTDNIKLSIYNELLLNIIGTTYDHFYDHNRIGLSVEYKLLPYLKFDIGFIHIIRLPITNTTKLHENNIFLNLNYQLNKRIKANKPNSIG